MKNALFSVVLYQPEIPPNTGNVIRLCANAGVDLHLIEPLGFQLDDSKMRRAGLDYHEWARLQTHSDWAAFLQQAGDARILAISTKGETPYAQVQYAAGDVFVFGPETRGLPADLLQSLPPEQRLRIPMQANNRSLNLSNAVAVVVYEAWRQHGFVGGR